MKFTFKRHNISKLKLTEDGKYCKKVSFATQKFADTYIEKLQKTSTRRKVPINSYLCTKCNCWHLTSWEVVDISKVVRELNDELRKIEDEYNENYDKNLKILKDVELKIQDLIIESNNHKLENYKLRKRLSKYEKV